jgi:hypothetical protein
MLGFTFISGPKYHRSPDGSFYWVSALLVLATVIGTEFESYLWLVAVVFLIGIAITIMWATLLHRPPGSPQPQGPPPVAKTP